MTRRGRAMRWSAVAVVVVIVALVVRVWPGVRNEVGYLQQLGGGQLGSVRCLPWPDRREVELTSEGLTIAGDLYLPDGAARRLGGSSEGRVGGVVLLHGSSVWGRRLPLYPALAEEFTRAGHAVLAIDLRGFGDSDDPAALEDPASWNFAADAITAVDSLLAWAPVDPARIYLVGHSFGAGPALAAAQRDSRVDKVVLIGPSRRYTERFLRPNAPDSAYYVERWQRDMRLPRQVPYPTMKSVARAHNVEHYAGDPYIPRVPVLLTDGEREDPRDRQALRALAERMGPIATYRTTPGTDHYLHTARLLREPHRWAPERVAAIPCYNVRVVRGFVGLVDQWLGASAARRPAG